MSKSVKMLSVLIVLLMVFSLFVGCSNNNDLNQSENADSNSDAKSEANNEDSKEDIVINVWGGVPGPNGPDIVAKNFTDLDNGIKVVYTRYVNDDSGNTKLDTTLLSGGDIDVFVNHGPVRLSKRVTGGMCEVLDEYFIASDINLEEDFGISYATYEGSTYAFPKTNVDDFIWINKDMFDEAGLEVPVDWTWDEYKEIAKKLTKGTGEDKVYGSMWNVRWKDIWMKPAFIALGSNSFSDEYVYNLENEYYKKALQLRYDMEVTDQSQVQAAFQKTSQLLPQDMFFSEKVAMMYAGSWIVRHAKNETDYPHDFITAFAPLPRWDGESEYYNSCGALDEYMAINVKSNHKEEAWEYMKYWATEGFYPMCEGGKIPAWKNANEENVIKAFLGNEPEKIFDVESIKRVAFADSEYFTIENSPVKAQVVDALEREADKCMMDEQTVDEAIEAMKKSAKEIIEQSK